MQRRLILLILIPYSIALVGCGQSGALYYPKTPEAMPHEKRSMIQTGEPSLKSELYQQPQKPSGYKKTSNRDKTSNQEQSKPEKGTP